MKQKTKKCEQILYLEAKEYCQFIKSTALSWLDCICYIHVDQQSFKNSITIKDTDLLYESEANQ